jgi:N utilization substance protein B
MGLRRHIRELAIQALYQLDARGDSDHAQIEHSILQAPDAAEPLKHAAIELARRAWASHAEADELAVSFAPDWPTHRQPPVDRSILRLAYYEIASRTTPVPVAIDEAVELAKRFGSERSPSFINGVLDKMARHLRDRAEAEPKPAPTSDAWLAEALGDSPVDPQP